MDFNIDKAKNGATVKTRCGFEVVNLQFYNTGIDELPISAVVMEIVTLRKGRKKKSFVEPCLTLYHEDGRVYDDRLDDFDLIIKEH